MDRVNLEQMVQILRDILRFHEAPKLECIGYLTNKLKLSIVDSVACFFFFNCALFSRLMLITAKHLMQYGIMRNQLQQCYKNPTQESHS